MNRAPSSGERQARSRERPVGEWKGLEIRAFDFRYYEESTDSKGHTSRSYSRFERVLTRIDASCPALPAVVSSLYPRG